MQVATLQLFAILRQFSELAFVCATANLLQQAIVLKTLHTAVDATSNAVVAILTVDVSSGAWVRQATIGQQRFLLVLATRGSLHFTVVVILLTDAQGRN